MKLKLARPAHILLLIACAAALCAAQTGSTTKRAGTIAPPSSADADADAAARANADETFDLNITERRITERDFAASTSVELGEETARGLLLRVGVGVGADEINVLLRNVRGHVRFRASLERVLERLNVRRAPASIP